LVREFGFLQLRMVCELIALGCLIIHGDIEETKSRRFKTHKADDILNGLERFTPEFYPKPFRLEPDPAPGTTSLRFRPSSEYLTKPQLLNLYHRQCGTALHRGQLGKLIAEPPPDDMAEIAKNAGLLLNLLHTHFVLFAQDKKAVFCEFLD